MSTSTRKQHPPRASSAPARHRVRPGPASPPPGRVPPRAAEPARTVADHHADAAPDVALPREDRAG